MGRSRKGKRLVRKLKGRNRVRIVKTPAGRVTLKKKWRTASKERDIGESWKRPALVGDRGPDNCKGGNLERKKNPGKKR